MKHLSWYIVLCPFFFLLACTPQDHLTILHTNDTHSQVEPKANGKGGYARRMGLINEERKADPYLLLVDAGDFCQGTPYFNFYHGRVELEAMNRMRYDAATLGNHEFDNGLDTLAAVLRTANFPVVCANYDFTGAALEQVIKPFTVVRKGNLKIGIFGLGCDPKGLISDKNFLPAQYLEPYPIAQAMADTLRAQQCDIVVCLSHMGTFGKAPEDVCDTALVSHTRGIDVVIGGHTHQIYENLRVANLDGDSIPVCQMGKSGENLGKIVLFLGDKNEK
ncbi:MAG: metallophosphatase [Paludibacteraceae bacterium]|nr:metallophosphatase [Paludibacteraceae bacterium]